MHRRLPHALRSPLLLVVWLIALSGCATRKLADGEKLPDGPKIVVDGEQYVVLDAPLGSHLKRRVRLIDVKQPGISPTQKGIVTADTDTTVLPPTAQEMQRGIADQPVGGRQ